MRRRHVDWAKLVARWEASGESAAVFARRVGVSGATLCRWRRELACGLGDEPGAPPLTALVEVRPARAPSDERFEVRLAEGRYLWVPPSFDEMALERLLRVLRAAL